MKIQLAKTAGFCYGVNRAVDLVEQTIRAGKCAVTLGPIAHNHHLVERFAALGVRSVSGIEEIPDGVTVIIRSHGVSRETYRALSERGLEIIDATCPSVKRIHRLVETAEEQGRQPIIIGTPTHPEVTAIAGWCDRPLVFSDARELEKWLMADKKRPDLPITMVSQTTSTQNLWDSCKKIAKKVCTNAEIFDTICRATENRQAEAARIAAQSDAMIVVGDANSSNTGRLAHICKEHCDHVALVDSAAELSPSDYRSFSTIGITAGASTPAWIIKEVNQTMSEIENVDVVAEESFETLLENAIKTLNTGDKVLGTVTAIGSTEIQVDLGTKHAGYIPYDEVSADPTVKPEDILKVGDEIEVFVVRVNDQEGTVQLSRKKLEGMKVWDDLEAACENKTTVDGVIVDENKGGIVANCKGVRVFIPASQTGIAKGGDLSALKGQTVQLKITEFSRGHRGRVVGSIRAVTSEARKAASEKFWSEIEVGKKYTGTVKSLTSYGAFVDVGGVDGMVHVSELSWGRIKTPADVVKVGDTLEVFVIKFDAEKKKISLGYKTPEMNPWNIFCEKYHVGDVATVKVVKIVEFGAFAEIIPGVDGLIHISHLSDTRVNKVSDVLAEGQEVEAKIIDIDTDRKRISLSIRALLEPTDDEETADEE